MRIVVLAGHSALKTRVNALVTAIVLAAAFTASAPADAQELAQGLPWGRGAWCLQAQNFPNCSYPSEAECYATARGAYRPFSCFANPYLKESGESRPPRAPRRRY